MRTKGTAKNRVTTHRTSSQAPFVVMPFDRYQSGPKKKAGQSHPPLELKVTAPLRVAAARCSALRPARHSALHYFIFGLRAERREPFVAARFVARSLRQPGPTGYEVGPWTFRGNPKIVTMQSLSRFYKEQRCRSQEEGDPG